MLQNSPEWFDARRGKLTASRIADATARTKSGWGSGRANVMAELIAERLTGVTADGYTNAAMQWGKDTESEARDAYEFYTGNKVELIGFVDHPSIAMSGASPDGLVGEKGLVEIKCPNTATHIETLLSGNGVDRYYKQMQFQMACTGRDWCDFISFDPRMPEDMRLFIHRVQRSYQAIMDLEDDVALFLSELDNKLSALLTAFRPKATMQTILSGG